MARQRKRNRQPVQREFAFRTWGGKREGAGRKPRGAEAGVSHSSRPELASRHPVHVTLRLQTGLPSLRAKDRFLVVKRAFVKGCNRMGFRLCQFSVQGNHLHFICEAKDKRSLSRGMQGLSIRIARGLNNICKRTGKVFNDRYHCHVLKTPREVKNALYYVIQNARHHAVDNGRRLAKHYLDPFSSWAYFDGWREDRKRFQIAARTDPPPVAKPHTWLLDKGWRRHGLLSTT